MHTYIQFQNQQLNRRHIKITYLPLLVTVAQNRFTKKSQTAYIFQFLCILLNLFRQLGVHRSSRLQTCSTMLSLTDTHGDLDIKQLR